MLRTLTAQGERYIDAGELARAPRQKADRRTLEFRDRDIAQQWAADRSRDGRRNAEKQALSGGRAFSELALTAGRKSRPRGGSHGPPVSPAQLLLLTNMKGPANDRALFPELGEADPESAQHSASTKNDFIPAGRESGSPPPAP
jgi:hypothetical protein